MGYCIIVYTPIFRLKDVTPHISLLGAGQTLKQMVANLVMDMVNVQGKSNV